MHPPDGEHVGRVAASDEDHVVRQGKRSQIGRRPRIERKVRDVRVQLRVIEGRARRVAEKHVAASGEAEDDLELSGVRVTAERDDLPRIHPEIYD